MNKDQENPVRQKRKAFSSWAAVAALFGAGTILCPGCGTPLGLHLLPLAALFLAVRTFTRRGGRRAQSKTPSPAAEMETKALENQNRDGERV